MFHPDKRSVPRGNGTFFFISMCDSVYPTFKNKKTTSIIKEKKVLSLASISSVY